MIYRFGLQYNFVGRILGPRGMTAKQLEQETGCKIMVRGRGSMRDKKKVNVCSYLTLFLLTRHSFSGNTIGNYNNKMICFFKDYTNN